MENFRCFKRHAIELKGFNVIVGKNNVGKSTIIDAAKTISIARRYASYRELKRFKSTIEGFRDAFGFKMEQRDIPFSLTNLAHNYNDEDSCIAASFTDGSEVRLILINDGPVYSTFRHGGLDQDSSVAVRRLFPHSIGIVPAVGSLEENERVREERYVVSSQFSHLAPRHFRNLWYHKPEGFEEFRTLVEDTWPGYTISAPELDGKEGKLTMFFTENRFDREIYWAGHGFQVWIQLLTALVKLGRMDTLVLDEPDIYLHSDLQKRLIALCRSRSNQLIVATHAVDIIEELAPEDILAIDSRLSSSKRLSDVEEVQRCITRLGSAQNLKMVHFLRGKTCLFVEDQRSKYIKLLAERLSYPEIAREEGYTLVPLAGFSNWERLAVADMIFKNTMGERIGCFVILDRDYYLPEEIDELERKLKAGGVRIHVWKRKEIENYGLDPVLLFRAFGFRYKQRYGKGSLPISLEQFTDHFESILEELKYDASSQMIARRSRITRRAGIDDATTAATVMKDFDQRWQSLEYRVSVVPGKEFFSKLNAWLTQEFQISIAFTTLLRELGSDEIDQEIREVFVKFSRFMKARNSDQRSPKAQERILGEGGGVVLSNDLE